MRYINPRFTYLVTYLLLASYVSLQRGTNYNEFRRTLERSMTLIAYYADRVIGHKFDSLA